MTTKQATSPEGQSARKSAEALRVLEQMFEYYEYESPALRADDMPRAA
ncbi:MAG: hypothetical protein Q4F71_07585 [Paracoccus sp. (in: a-proteobacteria)]|nr:hypothetical protein [Paracoccus sp. (in: a-proteobacteria)]